MFTYTIERRAGYFGRTTERVEWAVVRSDGRQIGTYATRRAAVQEVKDETAAQTAQEARGGAVAKFNGA